MSYVVHVRREHFSISRPMWHQQRPTLLLVQMWRMVVNRLDCIKGVGEGYEKRRKLLENFLSLPGMVWHEEKGLGDG